MEEITLDQIPVPSDRKFLETRGVNGIGWNFIKLVCDRDLVPDLRVQLEKNGWKWQGSKKSITKWSPSPDYSFSYCIGLSGVAFTSDMSDKVGGSIAYVIRIVRPQAAQHNGNSAVCPSCGTPGEWVGLAMKCPKCWKVW